MKKYIIGIGIISLVAIANAAVDTTGTNNWAVEPLEVSGVHGNMGVGLSELTGSYAGPVFTFGTQLGASYGFSNGWVIYGNMVANRSIDALSWDGTQSTALNSNRIGNSVNTVIPNLGVQYITGNMLIGLEGSYVNAAFAPGGLLLAGGGIYLPTNSSVGNAKSVGYSLKPYYQQDIGPGEVAVQYSYDTLWSSQVQSALGYTGNGVANRITGSYSMPMGENINVGISTTLQAVNEPYFFASAVQFANVNNYQALTASSDYFEIKPGIVMSCPYIKGLQLGMAAGLDWFGYRNCNQLFVNGVYQSDFISSFVFSPTLKYSTNLTDNVVWGVQAQYNVTKVIYSPMQGSGSVLNNSIQVGTGMSYNF